MADVVKTLKIKKAGTPGNLPPPEDVPEAVPAGMTVAEGQPAAPAQSHVTLPKYAQAKHITSSEVKDSRVWTAWAIVATVAVVGMLALVVIQFVELNFYAQNPSVWTQAGIFADH